jgi:hypothetical protein
MDVQTIIDNALSQGDNVSESDAAYIERRRRALTFLTEVFNDCYWARDWPRRKTQADLTVVAGAGQVAVPWDFAGFGQYGGLYRLVGGQADREPLSEAPEDVITDLKAGAFQTDEPESFAIYGVVAVGIDAFRDLIQIATNPSELTFRAHYLRKPPKLLDAGDPDAADTLAVGLTQTAGTATGTTTSAHGFATDDHVVIAGADQSEYNGSHRIVVTGATTFTFEVDPAAVTPATGATITVAENVPLGNAATAYISEEHHTTVLLTGLKAKLRESKGDARWKYYENQYQTGVAALKREKNRFQATPRRLPSFFGTPRWK